MKKSLAVLATLGAWLAGAPTALAQGCIMCRTSAAAGGANAASTFDAAVLILLVPTISIFVGVLVYAFRYRNHSLADQSQVGKNVIPFPAPLENPSAVQSAHPH